MRKSLALVCTFALALSFACDSGGGDGDSDGGTDAADGGDRAATILGLSGDMASGGTVFTANCGLAACHGADGLGTDSPAAASLAEVVPNKTDAEVVDDMLNGVNTPAMPPQTHLSDQELADVLAYVTGTFG
jgi:mono/diheme cytochrome c family protein